MGVVKEDTGSLDYYTTPRLQYPFFIGKYSGGAEQPSS